MQLKYIDPTLQNEWENLVKNNPASGYMQSFFWNELKKMLGWQIFKIGIFENDKLIGGAIIGKYTHFKKFNFITISEGPVLPYENINSKQLFELLIKEIDSIADLTKGQLTSHLSIEPKLAILPKYFSKFIKSKEDQQPLKTLFIDLSLSEEKLLKQMKPKGRYNIKQAQKYNVEVFKTNLNDGLTDFLTLYKENLKKINFTSKDEDYFKSLAYCTPSDSGEIFFAKFKNKLVATALIIYYGNTATYLFGAMQEKYKKVMASYLIQYEIIKYAKNKGYLWYDLYGLSPDEKDPTYPWYGFSVFKRKFGGKEVGYIGCYDFIYNPKLYKEFLKQTR